MMKTGLVLIFLGALCGANSVFVFPVAGAETFPTESHPCPPGPNEVRLSIARVMRNLGRFLMAAEATALKGKSRSETVTDDELRKSILGLELAIACGEAAVELQNEDLVPAKALQLTGADREAYLLAYVERMNVFTDQIRNIKRMFESVLSAPADQRSYEDLYERSVEMNDHVNDSHRTLSCWEVLTP